MLRKLIKYDTMWINKVMPIYFFILLCFALLTKIASNFTDSFMGEVIFNICNSCMIGAICSCFINCFMRIWIRFRNNFYGDESYLTHTLPVSKTTLYNSKIISAIISLLITLVFFAIGFFIAYLDEPLLEKIRFIFESKEQLFLFIVLVIIGILEMIFMIFSGILGIVIGQKFNHGKTIKSVLIAIGIYWFIQGIVFGILLISSLLSSDIGTLFINRSIENLDALKSFIYITLITYLLFDLGLYWCGKKFFKIGVNVD